MKKNKNPKDARNGTKKKNRKNRSPRYPVSRGAPPHDKGGDDAEKPAAKSAKAPFNGSFIREPDQVVDAKSGRTLLIDAILKEDLPRIEKILKANANPNKAAKDGKSPLHYAVRLGMADVADMLLDAGAQINPRDKELKNPLFDALQAPKPLDMVAFLLEQGVSADLPDTRGRVPLHDACEKADLPVLRALLAATENPARPDARSTQPLHLICEHGDVDAVQVVLFERVSVFASDAGGDSCLHIAAARAETDVAHYLLTTEAALLVNSVNLLGRTPLHMAVLKGHEKLARAMIAAGANVNQPDNKGYTPLHEAAEAGNLAMVKALIQSGADVAKSQASHHTTPLILAIRNAANGQKDSAEIIHLLLEHNADINTADKDGVTPLMAAAARGDNELVGLFLAGGADAAVRDRLGRNVLQHCNENIKKETVELLVKADAGIDNRDSWNRTPLISAVMDNNVKMVQALLDSGADVNATDGDTHSALFYTLQYNRNPAMIDILIKKGADPNVKALHNGMSLLHLACNQGMDAAAMKLIDGKADLTAKDSQGRTPLHLAVLNSYGSPELVRKLLAKGADPLAEDNNKNTPYDMAFGLNKTPVLTLIKQELAKKGKQNVRPKRYDRWSNGGW
jgi:ankyrin repeat protein